MEEARQSGHDGGAKLMDHVFGSGGGKIFGFYFWAPQTGGEEKRFNLTGSALLR